MKKIVIYITLIVFLLTSLPSMSQAAEDGSVYDMKPEAGDVQYSNIYKFYMAKGEEFSRQGRSQPALEAFKRALLLHPDSQEARLKVAQIERREGSVDLLTARDKAMREAMAAIEERMNRRRGIRTEDLVQEEEVVVAETTPVKVATAVKAPVRKPPKPKVIKHTPVKGPSKRKPGEKLVGMKPRRYKPRSIEPEIRSVEPKYPEPEIESVVEPEIKQETAMPETVSFARQRRTVARLSGPQGPEVEILEYEDIEEEAAFVTEVARPQVETKAKPAKAKPKKARLRRIKPKKSKSRVAKAELAKQKPPVVLADKAPAPKSFGEFFNEYLNPVAFSDSINEKFQKGGEDLNRGFAPSTIKGDYRMTFGFEPDNFLWKDANADYHNMPGDTSWRYLFGQDRQNSYDKKIYSRLNIDVDIPFRDTVDFYNKIVIDPWTFVGRKRIYTTGSGGDDLQVDLKYWSNVQKTVNETYRTNNGDIVNIQEIKVEDEKTSPETYMGLSDWGSNRFSLPQVEIDRMYVPIRKSWLTYNKKSVKLKGFFMSSQDEALTSDDPMRLSNNKVWWEESPWLDTYSPSRVFNRKGVSAPPEFDRTMEPTKKGQWERNISFVARDSNNQRLTFLRGASADIAFDNGAVVKAVGAAPRNLWQTYQQANSIPAAIRGKIPLNEKTSVGALYTLKTGMRHNSVEAINNMFAVDGSYDLIPGTKLQAEFALSHMGVEEAIGYDNKYTGYAGIVGLESAGSLNMTPSKTDKYLLNMNFSYLDDNFFPGLSNYRFTRKDFEFAKHIYFEDLNPNNEAVLFGDGMDIGRSSFNLRAEGEFPDYNLDTRFDFRTVHKDSGDLIENVFRLDGTYKATPKLTVKGLAYFQHLPKTREGIDPLMNAKNSYSAFTDYFAYEDIWLRNAAIPADKDPSIGSFSAGLEYEFCDYFKGFGVYEATNDPKDWPRGLLNNAYVTDTFDKGVIWDQVVPFLYDQTAFGLPAYTYYNIYKLRFAYNPFTPIKMTFNYVYNDNKYAMATDDNSTHQSVEVEYKPNSRMTMGFLYQYTRQNDLYREFVMEQGSLYDGHSNIFASFGYQINEDQHFNIMFGEYVGYNHKYPEEHFALTALDTRHIIRVSYTGSWGQSHRPGAAAALDEPLTSLGPFNSPLPGGKFVTNIYLGGAQYEENAEVAPVDSDWDAFLTKIEFGIHCYDKEKIEGAINLGLYTTLKEKEKWNYSGVGDYQTDEMSFRGADVSADVGWAFNHPEKYISFTPLINAGYRRFEFDRSGIETTSTTVAQLGEVSEIFDLSYMGIGGRVDYMPNEKYNIYGKLFYAPLVYTPTRNEAIGRLISKSGNIFHAEGGFDYLFSEKIDLSLGGFWDSQRMDRQDRSNDGTVNAELPDNTLRTFGVKLGGSYKF
ncbi:MAG: hypothetical protein HQ558_05535 [Candidatus Omnitrophica bacterium]|nr:hypothetical protein [Candidatus Omnitrophota bacterium]